MGITGKGLHEYPDGFITGTFSRSQMEDLNDPYGALQNRIVEELTKELNKKISDSLTGAFNKK